MKLDAKTVLSGVLIALASLPVGWFGLNGLFHPTGIEWLNIAIACVAAFVFVFALRDRLKESQALSAAQTERDRVLAQLTLHPARGLQEKAIELHTQRLQVQIHGLRNRALFSFAPGVILCCSALAGPYCAYILAEKHNDWRFMLGGSTLAAVLLGAGTALLRHDNKMREQIQRSQGEYLYFSRLKTGWSSPEFPDRLLM